MRGAGGSRRLRAAMSDDASRERARDAEAASGAAGRQRGGAGRPVPDPALLLTSFRVQARAAAENGSPLTASLLDAAAESLAAGGPLAGLLADWRGHPVLDALPLRVLGAVHDRVLAGALPELAAHYARGGPVDAAGRAAFLAAIGRCGDFVRARCDQPVQTNEVRRCVALLPGFLRVAEGAAGRPLRLLEVGSSAGLLLCWDHYGYALRGARLGPTDAGLVLDARWHGAPPEAAAWPRVASREGCDIAPLRVADPDDRRRLASFVWPDQLERRTRLERACSIAARVRPRLVRSPVQPWLAERLAEAAPGTATVCFHSVVWPYLSPAERAGVTGLLEAAGERATADAPLAWLRMEGLDLQLAEVRLRRWPGGRDERIGWTRFHGQEVFAGPGERPAVDA